MPEASKKLPFNFKKVYGTHPARPETFLLDNEKPGRLGPKLARVRLLTDFILVKNGRFAYPRYEDCTDEFWDGIEAWGFMMSPAGGDMRWFAWSLNWWLPWPGKHMELVHIQKITGISKEKSELYRNKKQVALWLNTASGCSYALMEPDDSMDLSAPTALRWQHVLDSWKKTWINDDLGPVPTCVPLDADVPPPDWWSEGAGTPEVGKQAWRRLHKLHKAHPGGEASGHDEQEQSNAAHQDRRGERGNKGKKASTAELGPVNKAQPLPSKPSAPPPRSIENPAAKTGHSSSMQSGLSKDMDQQPPEAVFDQLAPILSSAPSPALIQPPKRSRPSIGPGSPSTKVNAKGRNSKRLRRRSDEDSTYEGSQDGMEATTPAPVPKRSKRLRTPEALEDERVASAGSSTAKDRLQREAESQYSPGPGTQLAGALPELDIERTHETGALSLLDTSRDPRAGSYHVRNVATGSTLAPMGVGGMTAAEKDLSTCADSQASTAMEDVTSHALATITVPRRGSARSTAVTSPGAVSPVLDVEISGSVPLPESVARFPAVVTAHKPSPLEQASKVAPNLASSVASSSALAPSTGSSPSGDYTASVVDGKGAGGFRTLDNRSSRRHAAQPLQSPR